MDEEVPPPSTGSAPHRTSGAQLENLQQTSQTFHTHYEKENTCCSDQGDVNIARDGVFRSPRSGKQKSPRGPIPEEHRRFVSYQVESLIKEVLEAKLFKVRYEPETCSRLAQELCAAIKDRTKDLQLSRYKLVTHVLLGEDTDKSVQVAARCLWNQETDNFAAATFRNNWIYAVAIVYGMYLE